MEDGREHEGKIYDFKTGQLLATTGKFSDKVRKHTPHHHEPEPAGPEPEPRILPHLLRHSALAEVARLTCAFSSSLLCWLVA